MDWYENYKERLTYVYDAAERTIAGFPAPLDQVGLAYADKFHPVKHDKGQNFICMLLPYWMKDVAGITDEQCDKLALTNVYLMLYYFIQDDVMDDGPASDVKEKLALGNLLYSEMLSISRTLFPSHSPYWDYYAKYKTIWASSVVNETSNNYFLADPIQIAHKAGPVKIASSGALLLGSKEDLIPTIEEAVDIALMTLQMADDWVDWKEDMLESSYNSLIAMIETSLQPDVPLTEDIVSTYIYVRCCMNEYVKVARNQHMHLLSLNSQLPELENYNQYILDHLTQTAESIESNRERMKKGGLNYFFEKQGR
ncbi:hypothetical protein [Paenibacillus sp. YIM B09110]|uniref:hypothetical protein n=1 Tax=Paenibacillus sp. YIM B09110 TaxID=3126102 RepID=UPI00301D7376